MTPYNTHVHPNPVSSQTLRLRYVIYLHLKNLKVAYHTYTYITILTTSLTYTHITTSHTTTHSHTQHWIRCTHTDTYTHTNVHYNTIHILYVHNITYTLTYQHTQTLTPQHDTPTWHNHSHIPAQQTQRVSKFTIHILQPTQYNYVPSPNISKVYWQQKKERGGPYHKHSPWSRTSTDIQHWNTTDITHNKQQIKNHCSLSSKAKALHTHTYTHKQIWIVNKQQIKSGTIPQTRLPTYRCASANVVKL